MIEAKPVSASTKAGFKSMVFVSIVPVLNSRSRSPPNSFDPVKSIEAPTSAPNFFDSPKTKPFPFSEDATLQPYRSTSPVSDKLSPIPPSTSE